MSYTKFNAILPNRLTQKSRRLFLGPEGYLAQPRKPEAVPRVGGTALIQALALGDVEQNLRPLVCGAAALLQVELASALWITSGSKQVKRTRKHEIR